MVEVSVVLPTFNRWPMVTEAIASVIQQDVDFELIVIDDGSTDETAMHLARWLEQRVVADRWHMVRTANRGPASARNLGASLARAPLLAFLDSDDLWLAGKLRRQLERMKQIPECVASQTEEIWLRGGVRVNPGRRHRKRAGDFFLDSLRTCLISPSAVVIRTSLFHELAGFDEDMRAAEDYDLWLRLLLKHPVDLLPEPLIIRRAGHFDQLSLTIPALDRFRILALLKLLRRSELDGPRRVAVCEALIEKCHIHAMGARRRGRELEATEVEGLAQRADKVWRRSADTSLEQSICAIRHYLTRAERGPATLANVENPEIDGSRSNKPLPEVLGPSAHAEAEECTGKARKEQTVNRLRRWAESKHLSELHLQKWLNIDEPGRTRLLEIAETLKMRGGQCIAALELLEEISVRESRSIAEILELPLLRKILSAKDSGPGRARAFLDQLRALRYPRLKRANELIANELRGMKLPPCIKVTLPRDLASDELRIEIIVRGRAEMEQALRSVSAKAADLMRLAAIIDGSEGDLLEGECNIKNEF
jgi:GT2 family glycosyltransferase